MANETRVRKDSKKGTLGAQLNIGATTINFGTDPGLPSINSTQHLPITIDQEIVYLTAYTAAATTGTIIRAQEGTTDALHLIGAAWRHGPTKRDISTGRLRAATRTAGDLALGSTGWTNLGTSPEFDLVTGWAFAGDIIEVGLDASVVSGGANDLFMDAITVNNVGTPVNSIGATPYDGTAVAAPTGTTGEGIAGWMVPGSVAGQIGAARFYRLSAADIHTSTFVTLRLRYRTALASPTRTFKAGASPNRSAMFWMKNLGPREAGI